MQDAVQLGYHAEVGGAKSRPSVKAERQGRASRPRVKAALKAGWGVKKGVEEAGEGGGEEAGPWAGANLDDVLVS